MMTPSIVKLLTRSMAYTCGDGWVRAFAPRMPGAVMTISFDLDRLRSRILIAAQPFARSISFLTGV